MPPLPAPPNDSRLITIIDPEGDFTESLVREFSSVATEVKCVTSLAELTGNVGMSTRLALCPAHVLPFLESGTSALLPNAKLLVWSSEMGRRTFELAQRLPSVAGIIAWPKGAAAPRHWELQLAVRHGVDGGTQAVNVKDCLAEPCKSHEWVLRATPDISAKTLLLSEIAREHGASRRVATRVAGVAHELFMNALYDAPVDVYGAPIYAHRRQKSIDVSEAEQVEVSVVVDETSLFLQVRDPFGGLRRRHVYNSIGRGFRSSDADAKPEDFIDSSHGGAGLGMHRIMVGASSSVFEVRDGTLTSQTAYFDLRRGAKHSLNAPRSLQFWRGK